MAMGLNSATMDGGIETIPAAPSLALVPMAMPATVPAPAVLSTRERPRRGLVLLVALSAGWGALFSYSIAYLSDDLPTRPSPAVDGGPTVRSDPAAFQVAADLAARPAPASIPVAAEPRPEPPSRGRVAELRGEASPARLGSDVPPATPVPVQNLGDRAEFVGTWGPTGAACGARSRRRGYIPARITPEGARAGRTICSFHDGRRTGNGWQMAADCSDRGRRWSSQVRLVVDGDRPTWTSGKGSSSYVRCGRRAG